MQNFQSVFSRAYTRTGSIFIRSFGKDKPIWGSAAEFYLLFWWYFFPANKNKPCASFCSMTKPFVTSTSETKMHNHKNFNTYNFQYLYVVLRNVCQFCSTMTTPFELVDLSTLDKPFEFVDLSTRRLKHKIYNSWFGWVVLNLFGHVTALKSSAFFSFEFVWTCDSTQKQHFFLSKMNGSVHKRYIDPTWTGTNIGTRSKTQDGENYPPRRGKWPQTLQNEDMGSYSQNLDQNEAWTLGIIQN